VNPTEERDYRDLLPILQSKRLDSVFLEFKDLTNAPDDLRCLLLVAFNLRRTFKALPHWRRIPPFEGWPRLASFCVLKARKIRGVFGDFVVPTNRKHKRAGTHPVTHPMRREIEVRPLYAMLCNTHTDEKLAVRYGALQLQILRARWAETQNALRDQAAQTPLTVSHALSKTSSRITRLPGPYALAVRDLSGPAFTELLKYLSPEQLPEAFCRNPGSGDEFPLGEGFADHFHRIMNYCDPRRGPREGGTYVSGIRRPRRPSYPDYIDYCGIRFGLTITSGADEESAGIVTQQLVGERSISEQEALKLGLDPQEVGNGNLDVITEVSNATSPQEALQTARARTRSFEIDKSEFRWNSQALRIDELQNNLLYALRQARDDQTISNEDLAAATLVAVAMDTGRGMERLRELRIEKEPRSEFVLQPSTEANPNVSWIWRAIQPRYKSELTIHYELEVKRPDFLRYRSSQLVTDLIGKYCKRLKIRSGNAFRAIEIEDLVKDWLKRFDPEQRITLNRLARLRWEELHRITGGDWASACLVLGVPQTSASVELHYAILGLREASELFEESSHRIWGEDYGQAVARCRSESWEAFVGCRAFPTIKSVQNVVMWLRKGSKRFFRIEPTKFDFKQHGQILNRAVLYLVWHQFFAFGTRAIRDAYQEKDAFAASTSVGILSDKDFRDGYKTRIIWACPPLADHMRVVKERMVQIAKKLPNSTSFPDSSIWFLDDNCKPLAVTPTNISAVLGARFPFPVNTPRKVMRYLLRIRGVSHEHAEAYMGHWSHGREPWSPYSSFDYADFVYTLKQEIPGCLKVLGFDWVPAVVEA
jgi:hypothetical protein